jgi:hypothetical protein
MLAMKHGFFAAAALACALAFGSAGAASAAPVLSAGGPPSTYTAGGSTQVPATVTQSMGLENGTGALCLIGNDTTCLLPGSSTGGSSGLPTNSTYQAGNGSTAANTATTMVASPGAGHTLYAFAIVCGNSSSTGTYINLNDSHTLQFYVPPTFTGGVVLPLPGVIQWAANTAATFAVTPSGVSTMSCNFIGYSI